MADKDRLSTSADEFLKGQEVDATSTSYPYPGLAGIAARLKQQGGLPATPTNNGDAFDTGPLSGMTAGDVAGGAANAGIGAMATAGAPETAGLSLLAYLAATGVLGGGVGGAIKGAIDAAPRGQPARELENRGYTSHPQLVKYVHGLASVDPIKTGLTSNTPTQVDNLEQWLKAHDPSTWGPPDRLSGAIDGAKNGALFGGVTGLLGGAAGMAGSRFGGSASAATAAPAASASGTNDLLSLLPGRGGMLGAVGKWLKMMRPGSPPPEPSAPGPRPFWPPSAELPRSQPVQPGAAPPSAELPRLNQPPSPAGRPNWPPSAELPRAQTPQPGPPPPSAELPRLGGPAPAPGGGRGGPRPHWPPKAELPRNIPPGNPAAAPPAAPMTELIDRLTAQPASAKTLDPISTKDTFSDILSGDGKTYSTFGGGKVVKGPDGRFQKAQ